jgi:transposase-like protein
VERIEIVLSLLAEGVAVATLVRVFGHEEETITCWLTRAGKQAGLLDDYYFHDLRLDHVQVDELYARVRGEDGMSWVWAAIEPRTKIVPSLHVGQP